MFAKPTDLADYRAEKNKEKLKKYLSKCQTTLVFFGQAYQEYYGCFDRYECQCCIERYENIGEIPDFVLVYMRRLS
jgi:hypothetical protein